MTAEEPGTGYRIIKRKDNYLKDIIKRKTTFTDRGEEEQGGENSKMEMNGGGAARRGGERKRRSSREVDKREGKSEKGREAERNYGSRNHESLEQKI